MLPIISRSIFFSFAWISSRVHGFWKLPRLWNIALLGFFNASPDSLLVTWKFIAIASREPDRVVRQSRWCVLRVRYLQVSWDSSLSRGALTRGWQSKPVRNLRAAMISRWAESHSFSGRLKSRAKRLDKKLMAHQKMFCGASRSRHLFARKETQQRAFQEI